MPLNNLLEDFNGKFNARLRESRIKTSTYEEGRIVLTSIIGVAEAAFDLEVLDRLRKPCFIAVERPSSEGMVYLIYEVVSANPIHYQQLSMDVSMPKVLRLDFLDQIYSLWGKTEDAWVDILSVYTGYLLKPSSQGPLYIRDETFVPLVGAKVYLLSSQAVDKFINVEGGVELGDLMGFDLKLRVDLAKLIRYHGGAFGFTGTGKSNLTSFILRKVLSNLPDTRILIVDIAGEYLISLLDLIAKDGVFYSVEDISSISDKKDALLASQAIPESLLDSLAPHGGLDLLKRWASYLFNTDRVKLLDLVTPMPLTLGYLLERFKELQKTPTSPTLKEEDESTRSSFSSIGRRASPWRSPS
ncbi:MAG: ATP-binding protein [Candidatus Verstraetearchaeota archaeon]|nr:ATP-binding protein [Candidatus Verstraetearchaeota archaeon]